MHKFDPYLQGIIYSLFVLKISFYESISLRYLLEIIRPLWLKECDLSVDCLGYGVTRHLKYRGIFYAKTWRNKFNYTLCLVCKEHDWSVLKWD